MPGVLKELRPSWVAFGWFIAFAVTAALLLALVSLGVLGDDRVVAGTWIAAALALGFLAGGFVVGRVVPHAAVIHGVAIGLFSVVVYVGVNLFLGEPTNQAAWNVVGTGTGLSLLLLQAAAAVVGVRLGARVVTR